MTRTPVVSIVIPCFNHGHYLREALESIGAPAAATEIVVVDDGSTDDTQEVLASFRPQVSFRAFHQANQGLSAARNRGLQESSGEFVIFLDADDRIAAGGIDIGVESLLEHPECAFVFGRCRMMDRDGTLLPTLEEPRIVKDHYRELLKRNYIWMPAMVAFRREALVRTGGFPTGLRAAADYAVYLHIARHHPVHDHARVVAHYRKHTTNMSGHAGRMLRETLAVLRSQRPFLEGDLPSLAAYHDGWRNWQEFYGTQLATEIRSAVRGHHLLTAAAKALVLGRYHPRGLWQRSRNQAGVAVASAGRRSGRKTA